MEGPGPSVLVVAQTPLARLITVLLEHAGCSTVTAGSAQTAGGVLASTRIDLIVVDLAEGTAALDFASKHASRRVIVGLGRRPLRRHLTAFRHGIDALVAIPCPLDELLVRLCAAMRRARGIVLSIRRLVHVDRIEVDLIAQRCRIGGLLVRLSDLELMLLCLLAASAGRVVHRDSIIHALWDDSTIGSNVVDRHIRELRVKLGDEWREPRYIETVAGVGYRWLEQLEAMPQKPSTKAG